MNIQQYMDGRKSLRSLRRFGMEFTIKDQNLCDHGYNVATLFFLLANELNVELTAYDMFLAMNHDFVESITGDLNKLIKERNEHTIEAWDVIEKHTVPEDLEYLTARAIRSHMADLSGTKSLLLTIADAMDAWIYCLEERAMGNTMLTGALRHYNLTLHRMTADIPEVKEMIAYIRGVYSW